MNLLDEICSMLESYKGRDKILRTFCYSTRLVGGLTNNKILAGKLLFLSKHMSATRTTLRLFDDLLMLQYTLSYGLGKEEDNKWMSLLGVSTNIIDQIYFPIEKMAWLAEHKVISGLDGNKWDVLSTIFWVASIYLSLLKTLRDCAHIRKHINELRNENQGARNVILEQFLIKQQFEYLTALRLSFDLIVAINYLPKGFLWSEKLKTWHVGLFGTVSSILGLYQYLNKQKVTV